MDVETLSKLVAEQTDAAERLADFVENAVEDDNEQASKLARCIELAGVDNLDALESELADLDKAGTANALRATICALPEDFGDPARACEILEIAADADPEYLREALALAAAMVAEFGCVQGFVSTMYRARVSGVVTPDDCSGAVRALADLPAGR